MFLPAPNDSLISIYIHGYLHSTLNSHSHQRITHRVSTLDWIELSMVLCLRQHNIGYTADGFYRSDDPTNSVKSLKEGG